jgi:hypothetical protein
MASVTARGRASDVKLARALITTLCIEFPVVSTWVFLSQPPWVRHESDLACLTADSCKFTGTTTAGQFCSNHLDGQPYDLSLADCKQTCLDYQCSGGYWHPVHTENGETYGRTCKLYGGSIKPGVHCAPSPHWSVTVTLDCSTTGNLFCSRSDLGKCMHPPKLEQVLQVLPPAPTWVGAYTHVACVQFLFSSSSSSLFMVHPHVRDLHLAPRWLPNV